MPSNSSFGQAEEPNKVDEPIELSKALVERNRVAQVQGQRRGDVSIFTCPECGGTLWQVDEPSFIQFRCHVGHVLSGQVLFAEQTMAVENALWLAIRTLTDKSILARQFAARAQEKNDENAAAEFEEEARTALRQAEAARRVVEREASNL